MAEALGLRGFSLIVLLLCAAPLAAQEESPTPPPEPEQEQETSEPAQAEQEQPPAEESPSTETQPAETQPAEGEPAEGPPSESPPSESPSTETGTDPRDTESPPEPEVEEATDNVDPEGDAAQQEEGAPQTPQLTPEELAEIEEAKRKREARQAKRDERKAKEEEKEAEKAAKEEEQHQRQLAKVLEKGYNALELEEYKNALQIFQNHIDLEKGRSFAGHLGLARTRLALGEPARAIQEALRAAEYAEFEADEADALTFAADSTLAARPRDETTGELLPGGEMFETNALRFYMRALEADPAGAEEARARLDEAFPATLDEKTERLYERYLELDETGPARHAQRVADAYEAVLSGIFDGHLAVAAGISPPVKVSGKRPPYPQRPEGDVRRRLIAGLFVELDGTVSRVQVHNGLNRKLDRGAIEAFREWTFEPARLPDGTAVPVYFVVAANADVTWVEPEVVPVTETSEEPSADLAGEPMVEEDSEVAPDSEAETDGETAPDSQDPPDQGEPEPDQ